MKKNLFYIGIAVSCLALAMMACNALTSGLSSSGSGSGSGSSGNSQPTSKVLFQDDFSDSNSGWGTGSDANKSVQYSNNTLQFKVFK